MGTVNNLVVTKQGALLLDLLKVKNGTFTKFIIGDGYCYDDFRDVTALVSPVVSLNIKSYEKDKETGIVTLYAEFDNTVTDKDFWYRELGLMAKDSETGEEILFAYGNANELAEYIPQAPTGKATIRKSLVLPISVGNTDNITVTIDTSYDAYQIKSEKGQPNGYASLDKDGLVPKEQLPVTDYVKGCVNSGSVDENGEPDLLSYEEDTQTVTVKSPFVYTTVSGKTYTCNTDLTIVLYESFEETVRIWVNRSAAGEFYLEALTNKTYIQKAEPQDAQENDIWIDTSIAPETQKIKTTSGWEMSEMVEIGSLTELQSGGGSS